MTDNNDCSPSATRQVRILSIDGGGIKGIIPATIVNYLEKEIQERTHNPDARISDYFDLLAGTSTGGILTCAYLTPAPDSEHGRPMTAQKALSLYTDQGGDFFAAPMRRRWATLFGLRDEKYSVDKIEQVMKENFGEETRLSDMIKPCLITSYDITERKAVFFGQLAARKNEARNFKIWEVARATSAAPTYFEPAKVRSGIGLDFPLIDGGLFANNPAMCAYIEAHKTRFSELDDTRSMVDFPLCSDMFMLSIGTGSAKRAYEYDTMKDKGALSWIKPVIDIMMSGSSETVDYQLQQVFDTCQKIQGCQESNYLRLNPGLGQADSAMDNASPKNLEALHQAGLRYVAEHKAALDAVVTRLLKR